MLPLKAYEDYKLLGSPEKDILADKAKVVGAVINSSSDLGAHIE